MPWIMGKRTNTDRSVIHNIPVPKRRRRTQLAVHIKMSRYPVKRQTHMRPRPNTARTAQHHAGKRPAIHKRSQQTGIFNINPKPVIPRIHVRHLRDNRRIRRQRLRANPSRNRKSRLKQLVRQFHGFHNPASQKRIIHNRLPVKPQAGRSLHPIIKRAQGNQRLAGNPPHMLRSQNLSMVFVPTVIQNRNTLLLVKQPPAKQLRRGRLSHQRQGEERHEER